MLRLMTSNCGTWVEPCSADCGVKHDIVRMFPNGFRSSIANLIRAIQNSVIFANYILVSGVHKTQIMTNLLKQENVKLSVISSVGKNRLSLSYQVRIQDPCYRVLISNRGSEKHQKVSWKQTFQPANEAKDQSSSISGHIGRRLKTIQPLRAAAND